MSHRTANRPAFARRNMFALLTLPVLTSLASASPPPVVIKGLQPIGLIASDIGAADEVTAPRGQLPATIDSMPGVAIDSGGSEESAQAVRAVMQSLARKDYKQALATATELSKARPDDPVAYNLQGAAYLGLKDVAKARASFDRAVRAQPNHVPALLNLAQLDVRQKKLADARARYQAVLAIEEQNAAAMLGMAQVESIGGNERGTREWLQRAKRAQPNLLAPRFLLAFLDLREREYTNAVTEMTAARQVAPDNADVLQMLGHAQAAAGQSKAAVETYAALVSLRPKSPIVYLQLANMQTRAGEASAAEATLGKALQVKPDYVDAMAALAYLHMKAGRDGEALKLASKVQTLAPASGKELEGDILSGQKRFPLAVAAYDRAFAIAPSSILAAKLHSARTRAGDPRAADEAAKRWTREHPRDVLIRRYLAAEYLKAGRNREAQEQYEAILTIDPKSVEALNNLAMVYRKSGDRRARTTAEKAYALAPGSAIVGDTLGWLLVESGEVTKGLTLLQKASASRPDDPEIQYHFAAALYRSGERDKARQSLRSLLASQQEFPQRADAEALLKAP
jgi:putative PEP-CTERM system TPR-repeat lipoprotein